VERSSGSVKQKVALKDKKLGTQTENVMIKIVLIKINEKNHCRAFI
jgi:hypothetical protein